MKVIFPFEEKPSNIFARVKRPVAIVSFWSNLTNTWLDYKMIVDTGADFTILPKFCSIDLGINLKKDCWKKSTAGVGGNQTVFLLKEKAKMKIKEINLNIPLGFIDSNDIPPLLRREECLNLLKLTLLDFQTEIEG